MDTQSIVSPPQLSPRKPLQNLSTNTQSPTRDAFTKHASPLKRKLTIESTPILTLKDKYPSESQVLNASKKRHFDEIGALDERDSSQTRASITSNFSSFIDYDPPTISPEQTGQRAGAVNVEDTSIKNRTDTLRLRLQMAMFRVQTNQLKIPLSSLKVPNPSKPPACHPCSLPSTPLQKRRRAISSTSTQEDELPHAANDETIGDEDSERRGEHDLTSSAVKDHAISGLLELRRST